MNRVNFRVVPLAAEVAQAARRAAAAGAADHVVRLVDSPETAPCRHCLRWAEPGERVVLFPYASIPPGRPYSETGPIFVHEGECLPYNQPENYPSDFRRHRVLRAYNRSHDMIDAVIIGETEPEEIIS